MSRCLHINTYSVYIYIYLFIYTSVSRKSSLTCIHQQNSSIENFRRRSIDVNKTDGYNIQTSRRKKTKSWCSGHSCWTEITTRWYRRWFIGLILYASKGACILIADFFIRFANNNNNVRPVYSENHHKSQTARDVFLRIIARARATYGHSRVLSKQPFFMHTCSDCAPLRFSKRAARKYVIIRETEIPSSSLDKLT